MRISVKLLLISELVLLLTVLVLVVPVWRAMGRQVTTNMQNELKAIATTAALEIDGDLHTQIRKPADAELDAFDTLRRQLATVQMANDVPYDHIYTFYRDGESVRFAVMLHDEPFVGDPYTLQPLMRGVLEEGAMAATELYEDEHGQWISAYAPIRNRAGEVVGLLEVDKDSAAYLAAYRRVTRLTVAIALIALAISSIVGWFVLQRIVIRPMSAVHNGLLALGRNEFKHRIEIATGDEFEAIGATLNDLSGQLDAASVVQSGFFPESLPENPRYRIAASSVPCDATGGDYYDAFTLDDGRIAILVADVSGHGLGPSLLMASCRSALRALCMTTPSPGELLGRLDTLMGADLQDGRFITMIFGLLEEDGAFTFSNAGHGPAMVLTNGETRNLDSHAPPLGLGLVALADPTETRLQLNPGDRVFLASDGVNEAMSPTGELYGMGPIRRILADRDLDAETVVTRLTDELLRHCGGRSQTDDVTMLCVDRI